MAELLARWCFCVSARSLALICCSRRTAKQRRCSEVQAQRPVNLEPETKDRNEQNENRSALRPLKRFLLMPGLRWNRSFLFLEHLSSVRTMLALQQATLMLMLLRRLLRPPPSLRGLQAPPALALLSSINQRNSKNFLWKLFFSVVAVKMAAFHSYA